MNRVAPLLLCLMTYILPGNAAGAESPHFALYSTNYSFTEKASVPSAGIAVANAQPAAVCKEEAGASNCGDAGESADSSTAYPQSKTPRLFDKPPANKSLGIQWKPLISQMGLFTSIEHALRMTEEKTRRELTGPFFRDWKESVQGLHGWSDGNKFFTNYIAHPMEGAAAGFIYKNNDNRYRQMIFDLRDAQYWKMAGLAFAMCNAYNIQFELGPYSEASLGNVGQPTHPGYSRMAYVDLVITPTLGIAWMIGEDALDKHVIQWIEGKSMPNVIHLTARVALNPVRAFANAMRFKSPSYRDDRR